MAKVIGITGGTGSGKSTLVRKIAEGMAAADVVVIPQDSYYKDLSHMPLERRRNNNFDHPDAFDWTLLLAHIDSLMHGRAIEMPVYDYATSARLDATVRVEPAKVIVIEGIMALYDSKLRSVMDLCVYVDAPADERLLRVIQRDIAERDLSLSELMVKYREKIKPMHDRFIEPMKQHAHIIVPTTHDTSRAVGMIRDYIARQIAV